ncbi:MAG: helix-turn-helix domain-containing protein [Rhodospirillales bacterium]|nr:helix-turn-helix domain-containing protein [Rhodospirillales bacterium]
MKRHIAKNNPGPARRGDPVDFHVGLRIQALRRERGLSTRELDRTVGISSGSVDKFERGTGRLSSGTLLRLAKALGVSVSAFYDGLPDTRSKPDATDVPGPVRDADQQKLLAAFFELPTPELRMSIVGLVKSLAASSRKSRAPNNSPPLSGPDAYDIIVKAVRNTGMICRGAFHPAPHDGLPERVGTLVLIGNAGPALWDAFSRDRRPEPDPLDSWTRRVLSEVAMELGANVLFPFDGPPYMPFQKWALACDSVYPSPIGPLIHPVYGLWHAYRGALLFKDRIALPDPAGRSGNPYAPRDQESPCSCCDDKPCLTACPVSAFSYLSYNVPACAAHLDSPAGQPCMSNGCQARLACPVGRDFIHGPEQMRFHMEHFLRARKA